MRAPQSLVTGAAVILLYCTSTAACAQKPGRAAAPVPTMEGRTGVRVLPTASGDTAPGPAPTDAELTPAHASTDNRLPEYPGYALKFGCRRGVVPVRVHIGADGNVAAQTDIPGRPLPGDSCHTAFRAAVQAAVSAWKFAPAFRMTAIPGRDVNGDGRPDMMRWESVAVAIHVDMEFTFDVVAGQGVVRTR